LVFEETRWNIAAEAWGVFGASVVVWFLVESRSDAFQRRVWLRENAEAVSLVLRELNDSVRTSFAITFTQLGLSQELALGPILGAARAERRAAAIRARVALDELRPGPLEEPGPRPELGRLAAWREQTSKALQRVEVVEGHAVVSRFPKLLAAVGRFTDACRFLLHNTEFEFPSEEQERQKAHVCVWQLASAALDLSEACSDLSQALGDLA
jgi:hypothetical protein